MPAYWSTFGAILIWSQSECIGIVGVVGDWNSLWSNHENKSYRVFVKYSALKTERERVNVNSYTFGNGMNVKMQ